MGHRPLDRRPPKSIAPALLSWPVGPSRDARDAAGVPPGWYIATAFDQEYTVNGRPAVHPGLDLSGVAGGDSDLGAPVYAAADGVVVASLYSAESWGNVVLIRHDDIPGHGTLWTQYAHLQARAAPMGLQVPRGFVIGTVGKGADDRFAAHLHFEVRRVDLPSTYWPGNHRDLVRAHYLDPRELLGREA